MYITGSKLNIGLDWTWTLLPCVVLFAASRACKIPPSTGNALGTFRPPAYIFGVMWATLSVLMGVSWTSATDASVTRIRYVGICITYALLLTSLCMWVVSYNGAMGGRCWTSATKQVGAYLFLPIFTFTIMAFAQGSIVSNVLLAPLMSWLLYAFAMTVGDILITA